MEDNEILDPQTTEEPETTPESDSIVEPEATAEPEATVDPDTTVSNVSASAPEEYYDVIYAAVNDALVAQTVTDGQNISTGALEYFKGILLNHSPFTDYVVYVGESYTYWWNNYEHTGYEYCLAYGDLELSGTTFTGQADIVTMRTSGENSVSFKNDQYVSVTAPLYYSRSNLGNYSGIVQKDFFSLGILAALVLGGVVWLTRSILSPRSSS